MNKQRVDAILSDLAAQAQSSGFGSYEAGGGSYEQAAAYESYLVSSGMDSYTARKVAAEAVKTPGIANKIQTAMQVSQGIGRMTDGGWDTPISAATFQLTVTRNTAAIAEDLPFAIFGSQDSANGYRNILPQFLGAGTVLTSVLIGEVAGVANANRARFTYTNGVNVDTVDVTCATYPYPSLLKSTDVDLLKMSKIRMKLSNAASTRQFDQDLVSFANSPFGKGETNKLSPSSFIRPDQFQAGITDLDTVFRIDKETSLVSKIINEPNFSMNYSAFVEKFFRQNTKGF